MNPYGNDMIVDQVIGSAYQVVRYVAANMETLIELSDSIDTVKSVLEGLQSVTDNMPALLEISGNIPDLLELHSHLSELLAIYNNLSMLSNIHDSLDDIQIIADNLDILSSNIALLSSNREALRRSYAEAGYNLVDGSFEAGGTLVNANDVLLHEASGKAYSGPSGNVAAGTDPTAGGWVDRSGAVLREWLAAQDGLKLIGGCTTVAELRLVEPTVGGQRIRVLQHTSDGVGGGEFEYDELDTTTADDNGWVIVTSGGARWKRRNAKAIYLDDFGLLNGGTLDTPLTNAMATAASHGISNIWLPANTVDYTLTGGLTHVIPSCDVNIKGMGDGYFPAKVTHTGDNVGITFTKGTSVFFRATLSGLRVVGNTGTSAQLVEFQDSWRCAVKHSYISGYSASSGPISLHNKTGWTEAFELDGVMSRGNLILISVKRTSASGGTNSFFGMKWRNVWHQFAVGNSRIMALYAASAADSLRVYGADLEFGGWFESGGGHRCITVGDNAALVDSRVTTRLDGYGGIYTGADLYVFSQSGTGVIDVNADMYNQQGGYADVSTLSSGATLSSFKHVVTMALIYANANGRSLVRVRGGKYRWQQSGTTDKTLTIDNLPCYSSFNAILSIKGTDFEYEETYQIDTHGANNLARVTPLAGSNQSTNFKLRVFGGGTGGGYSLGNGGKIDWQHLAATAGGTSFAASLEIEMK